MKKILLAFLMLIAAVPLWAYDFSVNGIQYNIIDETNNTVEVTFHPNINYCGTISIPSEVSYNRTSYTVTSIGDNAFDDCDDLTSVTIPNSVISIGDRAFIRCSGLTSVTIPNSVTSIGYAAFYNCSGLTSVTIPNSVTSIGDSAFTNCRGLTSVTIGNSVTSIGYAAFYNCTGLREVNITDLSAWCKINFGSSDANPLYYVHHLKLNGTEVTNLVIPNDVTSIGDRAFTNCSLTSVTIGNSVTSIGYDAFSYCSRLTEVNITDLSAWCKINFGSSDANPLSYVHHLKLNGTEVTNLVIPNDVTEIKQYAFKNCSDLTMVTIPNSVTSIGTEAFSGCSKILVINSHNITAPTGAPFDDVVKQSAVLNVPSSAIASYQSTDGWKDFANIREMAMYGYYDFEVDGNYYRIISLTDLTAEVVAKDDTYNSYSGEVVIPESVSYRNREFKVISIDAMTFINCKELSSIAIPQSIATIPQSAFNNCNALKKVTIADGDSILTTNGCFSGLPIETLYLGRNMDDDYFSYGSKYGPSESLKSVILGGSVKMDWYAFAGCRGLTSVTIGNSVPYISERAFHGCTGLTSVTIGNSVTWIGDYAFIDCSNLSEVNITDLSAWCKIDFGYNPLYKTPHLKLNGTEVTNLVIPNDVTEIKHDAFAGCALTSVTIHNSVTSIGDNAFGGCTGLTEVNISDLSAWCKIDFGDDRANPLHYAHHLKLNGTEVTNLVIPNDITEIKPYAFEGCTGLTSVAIPNSVTTIGGAAFSGCTGLPSVTIPNSVTTIGGSAFDGCTGLTEITIPNSVTSIGNDAFVGCMLNTLVIMEGENPIGMGSNTFGGNPLASIYIGRTMKNVASPFSGITSLSKVTLGRGMTSLQSDAFAGCTGIKELVIEGGESAITIDCKFNDSPIEKLHIGRNGSYAFNNRVDLKEVSVGDNVTSLPNDAFNGCSNITSLKLGNKLETIGSGAFTGCATLMNVYSTNLTPPTGVVFENKTYLQGTLYVVKGSKAAYEAADGWKEFWEIIDNLPFEVNGIWYNIDENGKAMVVANPSNDSYVGEVIIPATIEVDGMKYDVALIDSEAFINAINVTSITIEDSNQPLTIGASATEISAMSNEFISAFGASMIETVYVGRNLTYQDAPFADIASLKNVTIGGKVSSMGGSMFVGCENIETVTVMGEIPPTEAEFEAIVYENATLVVPVGSLDVYSVADGWKEFYNIQDVNGNVGVGEIIIDGEGNTEPTIEVVNGEIVINGGANDQIVIYALNGAIVYQGMNRPVAVAKGIYVVVVNGYAVKVVI